MTKVIDVLLHCFLLYLKINIVDLRPFFIGSIWFVSFYGYNNIIIQWQLYSSLSNQDNENRWQIYLTCFHLLFCANLLGWLKTLFHWINWNVLFDNHKSLFDDNRIPHYPINIKRIDDKVDWRISTYYFVLDLKFNMVDLRHTFIKSIWNVFFDNHNSYYSMTNGFLTIQKR